MHFVTDKLVQPLQEFWGEICSKAGCRGLLEGEEGSTHLNGSTERHLSITLAEVHVTHAQVCALQEHWEVYLSNQTSCLHLFVTLLKYMHNGGNET